MLQLEKITKSYTHDRAAIDDISIEVDSGVWGLLGPNGAGKSTLMRIAATLLRPDKGKVLFKGRDVLANPLALRRVLGYLPQDYGFYPTFTVFQTLDHIGILKGVQPGAARHRRIDALLGQLNLIKQKHTRTRDLSHGMRQRLGIAQALLASPELLIIDEPTAGLDPEERLRLHNLLLEVATNVVVIVSTHIVSDVAALCSRFALLQSGRIVVETSPGEAVASIRDQLFEGVVTETEASPLHKTCRILSRMAVSPGLARMKVLSRGGSPLPALMPATATLEDVYFHLAGDAAGRA